MNTINHRGFNKASSMANFLDRLTADNDGLYYYVFKSVLGVLFRKRFSKMSDRAKVQMTVNGLFYCIGVLFWPVGVLFSVVGV